MNKLLLLIVTNLSVIVDLWFIGTSAYYVELLGIVGRMAPKTIDKII